jgi:hypothetical protein
MCVTATAENGRSPRRVACGSLVISDGGIVARLASDATRRPGPSMGQQEGPELLETGWAKPEPERQIIVNRFDRIQPKARAVDQTILAAPALAI